MGTRLSRKPLRVNTHLGPRSLVRIWVLAGSTLFSLLASTASQAADSGPQSQSDPGIYLHVLKTSQMPGAVVAPGEPIKLRLHIQDPGRLASALAKTNVSVETVGTDSLDITLPWQATFSQAPQPSYLSSSWVIDFEESPLEPALAQLAQTQPGEMFSQVLNVANATLPEKNYRNGFVIASQAARLGEGDCTEHAVVAAALARAMEQPARVVLGLMLAVEDQKITTYGHAWTEIFVAGQWRLADATLPEETLGQGKAYTRRLSDGRMHWKP